MFEVINKLKYDFVDVIERYAKQNPHEGEKIELLKYEYYINNRLDYKTVNEIIGNTSWTDQICMKCDTSYNEVLHINKDNGAPITICKKCLLKDIL